MSSLIMSSHPQRKNARSAGRILLHCAVLAAMGATLMLSGCETPLGGNYTAGTASQNIQAVMTKAIGDSQGDMVAAPTVAGGVQELTRVDSAGPGTQPATETAVTPEQTATTEQSVPPIQAATTIPEAPDTTNQATGMTSGQLENNAGLAAAALNAPEPVFNLSLQDAIARAMRSSLFVKVDAYNPAIKEALLVQQEAVFDAAIFGSSNYQNTNEPFLQTGAATNGETWANQIGIKKQLASGGNISVSAEDTYRSVADPDLLAGSLLFTHSNAANLNFSLKQPLLRGFGADVNQAAIYLAQRDQRISLETFKRNVITTVENVEEAYHTLVLDRTEVGIGEQLLAATEDTERRVWQRREIDADKISVNQAIAAVLARRADLVAERAVLRTQSDKLKTLLNDPEISIQENSLINPTDKPLVEPIAVSTAEAIMTALRQRTEIQEIRLQLEQSDIKITVAKNDLLPQLDLTANVQPNGLAEGLDHSFSATVGDQHIDFGAGVVLSMPIGNRAAEAEVSQHKAERNQQLTLLIEEAQTVVQEVKTELREVLSDYQQIQRREEARTSAEAELKAITDKEEIVTLSPEFLQLKLDSQTRLATAETDLITAIVNYNIGIVKLEQAKGTLLEFDQISLNRPPVENDEGKMRLLGKTYKLTN